MKFSRKQKLGVLWVFIAALILSPLLMHLLWVLKPHKALDIILIDKTVSNKQKNEHESLNWLLQNLKVVKSETKELYSLEDYYGFFPQDSDKFYVSDFEKMDTTELQGIAQKNQMIYIADSYGVYANEWYKHTLISERSSLIYGGLTENEILLLENFKQQNKLIISEFNCIGSPTKKVIRNQFEELFQIKWTGWIGRYFDDLSESNSDIPRWLVQNFKKQHGDKWLFKKSGIAFVNESDQVEILEESIDLTSNKPVIYTNSEQVKNYKLPKEIPYPYWFDIMQTSNSNTPISLYHINTTPRGDSIMQQHGILKTFPAVIEHKDNDYKFYYFAGDFADNTISKSMSHYELIPYLKSITSSLQEGNRENFYWNYYYPLMTKILKDYTDSIAKKAR